PYGLEYIQVDEGYQRWHGEWEGNDRFPHGMKWLADRIRSLGLRPGIWIAPYVISEPTEVYQKHQEWLIRHPDGRIKRVGPWPDENSDWARNENPKRYGLDITHPDASEWMFQLFSKIRNDWGFEMYKIDFVDWSLLSAHHYYNPSVSRAEAYRKGFEIIRKATGPECHIQDCGPGPVTIGLLDSMRIELDQNYGYRREVWKQYFTASSSSAPAVAKRYYFHKRTWINDADHVCLNLLSLTQARAAATLIALSGGNILSGDRLTDLDPSKLEILKKILPQYGETARPVNMFDTNIHEVFAMKIKKEFAEWTIAGFFNNSLTESTVKRLTTDRLWLDPGKTYIAWDFWNENLAGEFSERIEVSVPPASVVLLAIYEKPEQPKVISTDRHVLQGAVELENVKWDSDTRILKGISKGVQGSSYNIYVYIPDSHPWKQGKIALYHDFPGYTLKMIDEHILRIHVRFDKTDTVLWEINSDDFLIVSG
ncbi:MAG: alpha-galactosidase, partial [Bacteroidales bacterium]|nr:alpha-galactosidase [Bacteroidales bacterium]